jgi:hypothetical protein
VDRGNGPRHDAMVSILAVLFVLIIIQGIITLANTYANEEYQPRKMCAFRPIAMIITFIVVIMILVMWCASAILLGVTTLTADFCIAPVDNIVDQFHVSSSVLLYYVRRHPILYLLYSACIHILYNYIVLLV